MASHSDKSISGFGDTARGLSRNPLGIIALFLVLVYGIASMLLVGGKFDPSERMPLIYFMVIFPNLVLGVFTWLVVSHSGKLFAPGDFRNEDNYVRMQLSAAVSLTAAASKNDLSSQTKDISSIVDTIQHSSGIKSGNYANNKRSILWVDDNPGNNTYERLAFESVGIEVIISTSTSDALSKLKEKTFSAIISDMGRVEGPREGYVLLDAIRSAKNDIPLFFYASSNSAAHRAETERHGGQGCTNHPEELFQMVTKTLISMN